MQFDIKKAPELDKGTLDFVHSVHGVVLVLGVFAWKVKSVKGAFIFASLLLITVHQCPLLCAPPVILSCSGHVALVWLVSPIRTER